MTASEHGVEHYHVESYAEDLWPRTPSDWSVVDEASGPAGEFTTYISDREQDPVQYWMPEHFHSMNPKVEQFRSSPRDELWESAYQEVPILDGLPDGRKASRARPGLNTRLRKRRQREAASMTPVSSLPPSQSLLSKFVVEAVTSKALLNCMTKHFEARISSMAADKKDLGIEVDLLKKANMEIYDEFQNYRSEVPPDAARRFPIQIELSQQLWLHNRDLTDRCDALMGVVEAQQTDLQIKDCEVKDLKAELVVRSNRIEDLKNNGRHADELEQENCKLQHELLALDVSTLHKRPLEAQRELKELWLENGAICEKSRKFEQSLKELSTQNFWLSEQKRKLEGKCSELTQELTRRPSAIDRSHRYPAQTPVQSLALNLPMSSYFAYPACQWTLLKQNVPLWPTEAAPPLAPWLQPYSRLLASFRWNRLLRGL